MSEGDGFDPESAAAVATGDDDRHDDPLDAEDNQDDRDEDNGDDVVSLGGVLGSVLVTLVAADERGPTAGTFQERLDLDEGTAHLLDGLVDIVLDLVDVEIGDTIGPAGKMAVGVSRLGGGGQGQDSGADQGGGELNAGAGGGGDLSQEAREVMAGVDSAS